MKRRDFLVFGTGVALSSCLHAEALNRLEKEYAEVEGVIAAVQAHMFPPGAVLPSAEEMQLSIFVLQTIAHKSFDRDIRRFVIEGARELEQREKGKFLSSSSVQKEEALRQYEACEYGRSWLSRILTLSMEGLFSDPIYGANIREKGWKALGVQGGLPGAQKRYIYG